MNNVQCRFVHQCIRGDHRLISVVFSNIVFVNFSGLVLNSLWLVYKVNPLTYISLKIKGNAQFKRHLFLLLDIALAIVRKKEYISLTTVMPKSLRKFYSRRKIINADYKSSTTTIVIGNLVNRLIISIKLQIKTNWTLRNPNHIFQFIGNVTQWLNNTFLMWCLLNVCMFTFMLLYVWTGRT